MGCLLLVEVLLYELGLFVLLALVIPVDLESVAFAHAHDALRDQTAQDDGQQTQHEDEQAPLLKEALDLQRDL